MLLFNIQRVLLDRDCRLIDFCVDWNLRFSFLYDFLRQICFCCFGKWFLLVMIYSNCHFVRCLVMTLMSHVACLAEVQKFWIYVVWIALISVRRILDAFSMCDVESNVHICIFRDFVCKANLLGLNLCKWGVVPFIEKRKMPSIALTGRLGTFPEPLYLPLMEPSSGETNKCWALLGISQNVA